MSWSPYDHDAWRPHEPRARRERTEFVQEIRVDTTYDTFAYKSYRFKVVKRVREPDGSWTTVTMASCNAGTYPEWYLDAMRKWNER